MSVDRTKILEAAQKHLAKGAYDKAIAEFQKLVKADPSDVRTWLKIGDLHAKRGAIKEAVSTYARVAEQYAAQGFFLKAVAVHKQILKLDPTRLDVQLQLAKAYENLQLISDALATYDQVAAAYARAGNLDEALSTLGKMCELEPENVPIRIKYAEALSKANRTREAADAFEVGMKLLEAQGRIDDAIKVAERLLFHRPDDVALARKLSKLYLDRKDAKRALAKLQICFKADPKDVPTLEMLAEAFHQLGQLPKTISVYREIARIHQEAGRAEDRARALKRILELDPGDAEARQALAAYAPPSSPSASVRRDIGPPPGAVVEPSRERARRSEPPEEVLEEIDDAAIEDDAATEEEVVVDRDVGEPAETDDLRAAADEEVVIVDEGEAVAPEPRAAEAEQAPAGRPSSMLPPEIAREAQIAKLLTETEVFLRYGLKQKVVEQLRKVLEIDPAHVAARERLKDVLIDRGEIPEAIAELLVLADLFAHERPAVATLYLRQALELDPEHPEARDRLMMLTAEGAVAVPVPSTAPEITEPGSEAESILFVDEDARGSTSERDAMLPSPLPRGSDRPAEPPTMHGESVGRPALVPPPTVEDELTVTSEADAWRVEDPLAPMSPEEFESAPLRPSAPEPTAARESVPRMSMPPGEVEELLDEADFFVAQGLWEEAKAMLRDALALHPRNRLIADKLAEIEELAAAHPSASRSVPAPAQDRSFALAEKLAEEIGEADQGPAREGSDVLDVEQVFAQFKKGVEQQVGLEDTETHFDLGIAYKEMGLLQDAIAEFELCLTNPHKVCIAHTMIGLCEIEKGDVPAAIAHFKKGLYAEHKTDREELGLYYELGRAHELLHDPKEALYYYEKVRKRDPSFRNVEERIRALARPTPTAATTAAPAIANEDIDAAFDDLMGDEG